MRSVVVVTVTWDLEPQNQNKHSYACFLYLEVKTLLCFLSLFGSKNTGDLEHDYAMAAYNLTCNHLHPTNLKKHSFGPSKTYLASTGSAR